MAGRHQQSASDVIRPKTGMMDSNENRRSMMSHWLRVVSMLLASMAAASAAETECTAIRGIEQIAEAEVVLIGDYHGTAEIPSFFHDLVCNFRAMHPGDSLLVGFELPGAFNSLLDDLGVQGPQAVIERIRADPFWEQMRDGRQSAAALALVEALVRLSADDPRLHLVFISNQDFDTAGADLFVQRIRELGARRALGLMGNAHARISELHIGDFRKVPFGKVLVDQGLAVQSLNISASAGEAWMCLGSECAPREFPTQDRGAETFIQLTPCRGECPYSGYYHLRRLTVSMPPAR